MLMMMMMIMLMNMMLMLMMMMIMMMMRRPSSLRVRAKPRHLPYIYMCTNIYIYIDIWEELHTQYIYIYTQEEHVLASLENEKDLEQMALGQFISTDG